MSRHSGADDLVIGGEPRVDLLPPVVKARQKTRTLRKILGASVVAVIIVVGAGVAAASWQANLSQEQLAVTQARTAELLLEQTKFVEVRTVQDEVDAVGSAREIGASTEVDWQGYFAGVRAVIPADVTIDSLAVDSESPLVAYGQPEAPLQEARIATLVIGLTSPSLPTVPEWLNAIKTLPGYADSTPGSITQNETGAYLVTLTVHIDEGARSNRFAVAAEGK